MSHNLAETLIFLHSFVDSTHILLDASTLVWYNIYIAKKLGCYVQVGKMEMGTKLWNAEKYYLQMGCQTILL